VMRVVVIVVAFVSHRAPQGSSGSSTQI
jgi:hypothetical protein